MSNLGKVALVVFILGVITLTAGNALEDWTIGAVVLALPTIAGVCAILELRRSPTRIR